MLRALPALALSLLALHPSPATAQDPATDGDTLPPELLRGRVLLSDRPADTATVLLHRVSPDRSGPVDSVRVGEDGSFSFLLPDLAELEDRSAVYFASVRRGGILYFGSALTTRPDPDSTYVVRVYESREAVPDDPALSVVRRNLFLESGDDVWRVTDLVEVRNEDEETVVALPGGATFRYPLPDGASDLEVGEGDAAPGALTLEDGHLLISAPLPPGERLYVVRYRLPPPPIRIPIPRPTEVVELLVGEPAPPLDVEGLTPADPVELQPGSSYRRFAGTDVPAGAVTVAPGEEEERFPVRAWFLALAFLLAAAGLIAYYRAPGAGDDRAAGAGDDRAPEAGSAGMTRERLLVELAELDETHDARPDPDPAEEEAYRRRRRALLDRLRDRPDEG